MLSITEREPSPSTPTETPVAPDVAMSLVERVLLVVNNLTCRHRDAVMQFDADTIRLKCPDCGCVSPGWEVGKK